MVDQLALAVQAHHLAPGSKAGIDGQHAAPAVDRLVVAAGEQRALVGERGGARLVAGLDGGVGLGAQGVLERVGLAAGDAQDALLMRMLAFVSEAAVRMAEVKAIEAATANGA